MATEKKVSKRGKREVTLKDLAEDLSGYIDIEKNRNTFSTLLDKYREEKDIDPIELYEKACIDRRLYSKIMGERHYRPSKNTAISLGLALHLTTEEMDKLLKAAGFILSKSSITDLTVMYCLESRIYSISDINALLISIGQRVLNKENLKASKSKNLRAYRHSNGRNRLYK
jgi:hypothetical protein